MAFLGHIIGADGIRVDTQKIEAVKTWPRPATPTEVRNFLGVSRILQEIRRKVCLNFSAFDKANSKGSQVLVE